MIMKLSSIIVLALTSSHVGAFSILCPNAVITSLHRISSTTTTATATTTTTTAMRAMYFAEENTDEKMGNDDNNDDNDDGNNNNNNNSNVEIASMSGSKENDVESMSGTIYDRVGFKKEQIAIGINPEQVLEYIGNRDDMIQRFKNDNSGMDDERAQKEVDKFMMDSEMVTQLMKYEEAKSRGVLPEAPPFDWFGFLVGGYLVFVVGSLIKKTIDRQNMPPLDGVQDAVDAVLTSADALPNAALVSTQSTVETALDIVQSSMV